MNTARISYASCRARIAPLASLLAFGAIASSPDGAAAHGRIPVLIQVTHNTTGEVEKPAIRSQQGDSIVFVSDGDVMGPGTAPGHREVYYYDVVTGTLSRLTTTTDGESYDATRETDDVHSIRPVFVTFISTGDLDPSIGNADHNPEVFAHFLESGETVQVTDTVAPVVNSDPFTAESGKCITFQSNGDLDDNDGSDTGNPGAGFSNADASEEIFTLSFADSDLSRDAWVTTQVSNGPAGTTAKNPIVGGYWFSRQCRSNAWESDHDQLGNGSTGQHIFNYTRNTAVIEQLSMPGAGINRNPSISSASNFARGPFVVYESDMDPIGNGSSPTFEIYRFRLFKNELWQYTFADRDSSNPGVSDGGGRTVFESTADLIFPDHPLKNGETPPFNTDGNLEIFLTKRKKQITQVTRTENCENTLPTMRDTGDSIAFRSTCDLIPGHNPAGVAQVFYYVLVDTDDPLANLESCKVADGCCNEDNNCLVHLFGRKITPPRAAIKPEF